MKGPGIGSCFYRTIEWVKVGHQQGGNIIEQATSHKKCSRLLLNGSSRAHHFFVAVFGHMLLTNLFV